MRILLLSPRLPALGGKGDQVRSFHVVETLARDHDVTVVTGGLGRGPISELERHARVQVVAAGSVARAVGALGFLARGRPGQVGWMTPPRVWRHGVAAAADADLVIAVTARALRGALPAPVVLDHIDALSLNLARRSGGAEALPVRLAARAEAALMARWECSLAPLLAAQITVSPVDARALPSPPEVAVVPVRADLPERGPAVEEDRSIDVVFTGSMRYGPNLDAARWIDSDIAPALWRRRPGTRVVVAGRDASSLRIRSPIEVRSDVDDMHALLSDARVALAPLRIGTGSPNKVLEAMAAGAVVVGTREALQSLALPDEAAITADTPEAMARAAADLLDDEERRSAMAAAAAREVPRFGIEAQRERLGEVLTGALARPGRQGPVR